VLIDSLVHVTPDGRWFATRHDASLSRLLGEMDAAGVEKAVVVALAGYIENSFVLKTCTAHSDRLIAGASLDPCRHGSPGAAAAEARSVLEDGAFTVLKLHPRLNGYDPLDPRCLAVLEAVAGLPRPMPIWLDTMFRSAKCLLSRSPVDIVHALAHGFPTLHFVLLHAGGVQALEMTELAKHYSNLTIDLSLTMPYYQTAAVGNDLAFILNKRDRLTILGSDFPEYTPTDYLRVLSEVVGDEFPEEKRRGLLGHNLGRLLGLTGKASLRQQAAEAERS